MKKHIIAGLVLVGATFGSTAAFAGPDCTEEPQDKWMSVMDMQKKIINDYGFTIDMFKVTSGNCYEIYGRALKDDKAADDAKEWVKTEVYFDPLNGEIVKQKERS